MYHISIENYRRTICQLVHSDEDKVESSFTRPYDSTQTPAILPLDVDKIQSLLECILCFALFPPMSKTDKTVKLNGTQTQKSTVKIQRFLEVLAAKGDMIQPCELDCNTQTHVE